MPIRKGYVDTSIGQIHYRTAGKPAGLPIVMLHQTPSSSVMFEALMKEMAQDYWIVAPDMPGFGASAALPGEVTTGAFAEVFKQALAALHIDQCWLFGHHTGASVAVQLEHDYPGIAQRIALSGPTLLNDKLRDILPTISTAFPMQDDGSHLQAMWARIRGKDPEATLDLSQRETLLGVALGASYPDAYKAVIEQDFAAQLQSVQCPTLVFAGTQDALYGQLDAVLSLLRDGRRRELQGGRTYICERNAGEVSALLREFFVS